MERASGGGAREGERARRREVSRARLEVRAVQDEEGEREGETARTGPSSPSHPAERQKRTSVSDEPGTESTFPKERRRKSDDEEEQKKEVTHGVKVARDERVELGERVLDVEDLRAGRRRQELVGAFGVEEPSEREGGPTHLLVDGQDLGRRLEREARLGDVVVRRVDAQGDLAARERRGERRLDVPARRERRRQRQLKITRQREAQKGWLRFGLT